MVAIASPETLEEVRRMTPPVGLRGIGDILRDVLARYELEAEVEAVLTAMSSEVPT